MSQQLLKSDCCAIKIFPLVNNNYGCQFHGYVINSHVNNVLLADTQMYRSSDIVFVAMLSDQHNNNILFTNMLAITL